MVSRKRRIMFISRTDGTRGPLGVARAVNKELSACPNCQLVEVGGSLAILKLIVRIAFTMRGWSICIHANGYRVPLLMYFASKVNKTNRYFCVIHGIANVEKEYRPVSMKDVKLEPYIFKHFQNVICVSDFERRHLFEMYGNRDHVYVIHNGVELGTSGGRLQRKVAGLTLLEPIFITTGGFEQRKAVDLALKLLGAVKQLGVDPKLIVCGRDSKETGSNRSQCEQIAKESGVEMVYEGEVKDKSHLWELYSQAHFYIGLSRFDTFNVSVLEGAMAGCIPVVSTSCGVSELFNDKNLVTVDIADFGAYKTAAERIVAITQNVDEYDRLSQNSQMVALANTWPSVAQSYLERLGYE